MSSVWTGDWKARLSRKLEAGGFASVHDLVLAREGKSYQEIAEELGDVAQAQLVLVHLQQCADAGRFVDGAAESMARTLGARLFDGWGRGSRPDYNAASGLAAWFADVSITKQSEMTEPELEAVLQALRDLRPPDGWLPRTGKDPLIQQAFQRVMEQRSKAVPPADR